MKVYEHCSLREHNTFGIDVRARRLVLLEPGDPLSPWESPFLILGAGSDMVFTRDFEGTVVRLSATAEITVQQSQVTCWGGLALDDVIRWCLDHRLYGLENLSAIPGTVGASVVQNVGAYGVEAKDVVERVEAYDLQAGRLATLTAADCRFGYRTSMFKEQPGRWLVLRVTYRLNPLFSPVLGYKALEAMPHGSADELRRAITDLRWSKLPRPEEHGSAGSFFKNPVVEAGLYRSLRERYPDMPEAHPADGCYKLSAGWLIDRAGWKGVVQGRVGVWPRNALVLYNAGGCSGGDVLRLAQAIQADVQEKFGIKLVPEAIIV